LPQSACPFSLERPPTNLYTSGVAPRLVGRFPFFRSRPEVAFTRSPSVGWRLLWSLPLLCKTLPFVQHRSACFFVLPPLAFLAFTIPNEIFSSFILKNGNISFPHSLGPLYPVDLSSSPAELTLFRPTPHTRNRQLVASPAALPPHVRTALALYGTVVFKNPS